VLETESYTVRLDSFQGPLDLLLYLIRRAEMDIHDIPVGTITEQYMAFLAEIDRIDMDAAGEFLLMAATLMEIKSRTLTPVVQSQQGVDGDGQGGGDAQPKAAEDPRGELVRQLLAYRRFRSAADELEHRFETWRERYGAGGAMVGREAIVQDEDRAIELEDLHIMDLVEAFNAITQSVDFSRLGEHRVVDDDTPIELHAADIVDRLERAGLNSSESSLPLIALFEGRRRIEMIGLFLATLELVRNRRVAVEQDEHGQIKLRLREPDPSMGMSDDVASMPD
jgi:segregation and condensation protein A